MIQCFVFSLPVCQPAFWRAMARRTALPATPRKPSPRVRDATPRTQEPAEATDDIETPTKRRRPGRIDIDLAMEMERAAAARAMKVVMEAKKQERNLKRRRQRLLKKASGLSAEDLERIALLKRCGLQPGGEEADEPHGSSKSSPQTKSASPDAQTVAETEIHREATEHPNQDVATVDDALAFGRVPIGSRTSGTVRVRNDGEAELWVRPIAPEPPFELAADELRLPPRSERMVPVSFAPVRAGVVSGLVALATNDPDRPTVTVRVAGEGIFGDAGPADASVDGGRPVGASAGGCGCRAGSRTGATPVGLAALLGILVARRRGGRPGQPR